MADKIFTCGAKSVPVPSFVSCQTPTEQLQQESLANIANFSRRQQRKMKVLFLKASKPILKKANSREGNMPSHFIDEVADIEVPAEEESYLARAEAYAEARRQKQIQSIRVGPLDTAAGAVDWMIDVAQGMPYDWPMFSWLKDNEPKQKYTVKKYRPDSKPRILEDVPHPRCEWPRTASVGSMLTSTSVNEASFPRCSWPKQSPSTLKPEAKPSLNSNHARCEWPRRAVDHVTEVSQEESERIVLERIYASHQKTPFAQCSWPRKPVPAAIEAPADDIVPVMGPRCPWPRVVRSLISE